MLLTRVDQTTDTTAPPTVEITEPQRPFSDFLVDVFDLDPDGSAARFLDVIIEPVLQIALILGIAWVLLRLLRRLGRRLLNRAKGVNLSDKGSLGLTFGDDPPPFSTRRAQRAEAMGAVLSSIFGAVVWTTAILTILGSTFGISLAPFLAGAGILGIALGFGAQDLVKDFISGIFMLIEDQYGVGDVVDVGDATGVVERVSLRTTKVRDVTGTLWHVPNGEIRRVGNKSQEWSRALLDVGISYGADVDGAAEVIKSVADEMAGEDAYRDLFLAEPEIWGVEDLSADAVLIRLVVKTRPGEQWAISRELRRRIKLALDAAEIEIPFPQRTIWIRREHPDAEPPATSADRSAPSAATGKAAAEEGAEHTSDGQTEPPHPHDDTRLDGDHDR